MRIKYSEDALEALVRIVNFVEKKNTQGAGLRWLEKFEYFLSVKLEHPQYISRCNNYTFKKLQLQCIYIIAIGLLLFVSTEIA